MRVLLLADVPSKSLWDYYDKTKLEGIDLILSGGDLPAEYLSFLVTFASCPVLYVHGNHDDRYLQKPPEGCICIDDSVYTYEGIRILGLGGCMEYSGGPFQFTEKKMKKRIRRLRFQLFRKKGFDILLTHAPAYGIGDMEDLPHRGFRSFLTLLDKYQPRYMVHGHVHLNYGYHRERVIEYRNTTIINAYETYMLDIDMPYSASSSHFS